MTVKVYNQQGEIVGKISLPKEIFGIRTNLDLLHQVVVCQAANKRQGTAHTKHRAEVSGGGRKPWRQKGLGRARHGSIRSPLWVGGGVTFGPRKDKKYKKRIPNKMRRKALLIALSTKARDDFLIVLDKLQLEKPKTKLMAQVIEDLRLKIDYLRKGRILIALAGQDDSIIRAGRNLPGVRIMQARELNPLDLLSSKYLVLPRDSIKIIEKTFRINEKIKEK